MSDDKHMELLHKWYAAEKKSKLRHSYNLSRSSVVFDLGAYDGKWASEIYRKFNCAVYAFEPAKHISKKLKENLGGIAKVYPFALGGNSRKDTMYMHKDASSTINKVGEPAKIEVKDIAKIVREIGVNEIDLLKMNIEGMEYEVFERLIEEGMLPKIRYIQVQFHRDVPDYDKRRNDIRRELAKTHKEMYCFDFIWESWERV
jgi:FkbM family methyltransferase